ncbi:DMT family transporter [Taylorella equigenitalis]|nr:DMT family transporter [Taylorella equigenitalis]WED99989.1 DMT family transporter [Taylorella equigenitalis]WEE01467.1 DMT family transporter [Taylorella equigenitalis]WFD78004.1 DMT family transporter [Taylorella equigenitalis]WFD79482.1 DMT family transporter [Taylorella equigenitalis]WFD80958.1 DMT family transporter [Taylorella equigenitalis]
MQSFWMLLASIMFAIMAATIKISYDFGVSTPMLVVFRGLPSFVIIFVWVILTHRSLKTKYLGLHIKRNVLGTTSMWLNFNALSLLPIATSTSLNYSSSLFLGLYLVLITWKKSANWGKLGALFIGFLGILLILRPSIGHDQMLGAVFGLSSGILAAFAMLQVRSLGATGEPTWRTVFYFSIMMTLTGFIAVNFDEFAQLSVRSWMVLFIVGLSGMGGQLALTQAYGAGSPIVSAVLQYSTIIFSAILGIIIWNTVPDLLSWVGMLLVIVAGVLVVVIDQSRALRVRWKYIVRHYHHHHHPPKPHDRRH